MKKKRAYDICVRVIAGVSLAGMPHAAVAQETSKITGQVRWLDSRGKAHPARFAKIELLKNDGRVLAAKYADANGRYELQVAVTESPVKIRLRSESSAAIVTAPRIAAAYIIETPERDLSGGRSIRMDVEPESNASEAVGALSLLDALVTASDYVTARQGAALPQVRVEFPTTQSTSQFGQGIIYLLGDDRWDWDVAMHEYGHYVSKSLRLDNNPGGRHFFGNLSEEHGKDKGTRLAWGEGWPTYFAIAAQLHQGIKKLHVPNAGDTRYQDTVDSSIDVDLEGGYPVGSGEDDELSVMRVLFDAGDSIGEAGADKIEMGDAAIWNALSETHPTTLSGAVTALVRALNSEKVSSLGTILETHRVGPRSSNPPDQVSLTLDSIPALAWEPQGGGPSFRNNTFTVTIFDKDWNRLFVSPEVRTDTYALAPGDWNTIWQDRNVVRWVVTARNTSAPATGPYAGPARSLKLRR